MIDVPAVEHLDPFSAAYAWVHRHLWMVGWWLGGRAVVFAAAAASSRSVGALHTWDARWYRIVASNGYLLVPGQQSDPAFFPLYPVLLRVVHASGIGYATAGVASANVAFPVALVAFHALTRELLGDAIARRATVYLAIFPLGYVFSMAYPESLVLAAIALAGVSALRGRWGLAAAAAAGAALARPEGVLVALPLLVAAWQGRSRLTPVRSGVALGSVLAAAGGFAAYPLYLDRVLHDPTAWSRAERAWGRRFTPFGAVRAVQHLPQSFAGDHWVARDVAATVCYLLLLAAAARAGAPRAWLAVGAAIVVLPLFSGSFTSIGRFGLIAPPIFWGLAWLGRNRMADYGLRVASIALLVAATATVPLAFP